MTGPLAGIRVVELVGQGPGPYGAALLADLGADVIAVDRPEVASRAKRDRPATNPMMYLSGMDKGRVQINISVVPTDRTATMGLDARGTYSESTAYTSMQISSLTPTICAFQTNSPGTVTSLTRGGPIFVMPLATGTCSVRINFAGIPSYKVDASTVTWTATVSK